MPHIFFYCYASLCCGPHLHKHNQIQNQSSIWDLFMTVANHNIWGYSATHHCRIALTLCYNRRPLYRHSVGRLSILSSCYHFPNLLFYVRNCDNDMSLWQHVHQKTMILQHTISPYAGMIMCTDRFNSHCPTGPQQ